MGAVGDDHDRAVDSVMRAVDCVEERMAEDIGAQDLARAALYSAFYFSRLFVRATGHAPYDYLMRRRVAAAAEQVVAEARSITEIALDFGFDVPDTFARAFRRCFGCLPSEARRDGTYPRSMARTRITRSYVEGMLAGGPPTAEPEDADDMVVEGEWRLASGSAPMGELADRGVMVVERDDSLRPRRALVGVRSKPAESRGWRAPAFPLSAAAVAGGQRARFRFDAPEDLDRVVEYAYRAWLPSSGRTLAPRFDLIEAESAGGWCLVLPLEPTA